MSTLLADITALADELCDPRQHTERVYGWTPGRNRKLERVHTTIQPGLIQQLRDAIYPRSTSQDEGTRTTPGSKPPLHIEAIGRHITIAMGANHWTWSLKIPNRSTPENNIRALAGAAPRLDTDTLHLLRADLRQWRTWAAVLSGWALPPYCPRVHCPNPACAKLGTLRILVERKTGTCSACGNIWDEQDGSINLLAAYITEQTDHPRLTIRIASTVAGHGGWASRHSQPT